MGKVPSDHGAHTKQTQPHDAHIRALPQGVRAHMFRAEEEEAATRGLKKATFKQIPSIRLQSCEVWRCNLGGGKLRHQLPL